MSYKLPDQPEDTPRVNEHEFESQEDCYGQICGLITSNRAREIERDLNKTRALAQRLYRYLCKFDCGDDDGQDLKEEAETELS
jgi:hypothetical protein